MTKRTKARNILDKNNNLENGNLEHNDSMNSDNKNPHRANGVNIRRSPALRNNKSGEGEEQLTIWSRYSNELHNQIDPFSIQETEITLGAGSVVYASDAIGGVMSFYTQKPQLSYKDSLYFQANSTVRYASANEEKTGHLDFNFGFKKWALYSSVSFTDFDDLRMGSHGPDDYLRPEFVDIINGEDVIVPNDNPQLQVPTGYDQLNILQKVRYEPKEDLSFDLGLYYTRTSDYPRYDRLLRYRDEMPRSAEWNYGPQRWFMANMQVT